MIKYYDATEEGHRRIAMVDWDSNEDEDGRFGAEIDECDLPKDFDDWILHRGFAHIDCLVDVRSRNGD